MNQVCNHHKTQIGLKVARVKDIWIVEYPRLRSTIIGSSDSIKFEINNIPDL